jgi:hypothetical protein
MEKGKASQKGAGKQRPGTEQVRSGTHIQKGASEKITPPKAGEQVQQRHEQGKSSKKVGGTGS